MTDRDVVKPEDVERKPDGIPHMVIALTVLVAALLVIMSIALLSVETVAARVALVTLGMLTLFVLIGRLQRKAARDRDHVHPSR